jgi:hypothetical protein
MKKIIVFTFLFASVTASAQNNPVEDTTAKPAITAIGKPDGAKTEMKIGKDGGSITSSDGKTQLIIPEGAVSKKTTFSIQPTTNLMPNGNGKAYQMEPSGINFQKPLQIIFNYTDAETEGNSPELLAIAMQDDKGQWSAPNKITTDTIAKTLTAEILHFSSYVIYELAEIIPASARVKVNGSLRLRITNVVHSSGGESHTYINGIEVQQPLKVKTGSAEVWKVNGIEKGNSTVGIISASQDYTAIFQAPAQVPSQNPVAVTVQENLSEEYAIPFYRTNNIYTLVSKITIYDGDYEVKMISTMDGSAGSQLGVVKYKDNGSFIISLNDNKAKVTEVVNKNAEFTYIGKCTIVQLKPGQGNINIIGVQGIRVIPGASPKDNPWVEIFFVRSPTVLPLLQFTCPDLKGGTFTTTAAQANAIGFTIPAFPMSIKFEAKEGEQTILKFGEEGGEIYARFTVKKITDE